MAGRPPAHIITANFTTLEKVNNKSGRYWYKCNYCDDGPGARIQGHDNRHIIHLTKTSECPNCPANVRQEAHIFLISKGNGDASINVIDAAPPAPPAPLSSALGITQAPGVVTVVKKRKSSTLAGFVDYPMVDGQKARANLKLFR